MVCWLFPPQVGQVLGIRVFQWHHQVDENNNNDDNENNDNNKNDNNK